LSNFTGFEFYRKTIIWLEQMICANKHKNTNKKAGLKCIKLAILEKNRRLPIQHTTITIKRVNGIDTKKIFFL
jgi:hypothetical protein